MMLFQDISTDGRRRIDLHPWGSTWSAKPRMLDLRTVVQVACGAYFIFLTTISVTVLKSYLHAESMEEENTLDVSHLNLVHALIMSPFFLLIFVILTGVI
jgi:hypothetical protein